jgi:hypothetical protein
MDMEKSMEEILKEQDELYQNLSPKKKKALNEFVRAYFFDEGKEEDHE